MVEATLEAAEAAVAAREARWVAEELVARAVRAAILAEAVARREACRVVEAVAVSARVEAGRAEAVATRVERETRGRVAGRMGWEAAEAAP